MTYVFLEGNREYIHVSFISNDNITASNSLINSNHVSRTNLRFFFFLGGWILMIMVYYDLHMLNGKVQQ